MCKWRKVDGKLVGVFEAPIAVGIVGGVTRLHPLAQMSLKMLGVNSSDELARICAAVGVVQNLGAIKALTTSLAVDLVGLLIELGLSIITMYYIGFLE